MSKEGWLLEKLCTQDESGNYQLTNDGVRALKSAKVENLMISSVTESQFKKLQGMVTW